MRALLGATPGDPGHGAASRLVRRLRDDDLHDRLGPGRLRLRHPGRQIGRAKTMLLTVLCYSVFTGL